MFRRRGNRLSEINNRVRGYLFVGLYTGEAEETREDTSRPVSPTKGLTIANSLMSRAFIVSRLPYRGFNSGSVARGERVKGGVPEEDARSREGEGDRNTGTDLLFPLDSARSPVTFECSVDFTLAKGTPRARGRKRSRPEKTRTYPYALYAQGCFASVTVLKRASLFHAWCSV